MADEDRPLKAAGDAGADAWLAQIMAAGSAPANGDTATVKPAATKKPYLQRKPSAVKSTAGSKSPDDDADTMQSASHQRDVDAAEQKENGSHHNHKDEPESKQHEPSILSSPPLPRQRSANTQPAPHDDSASAVTQSAAGDEPPVDSTTAFERMMLAAMQAEASNPAPMSKAAQQRNATLAANKPAASVATVTPMSTTDDVNNAGSADAPLVFDGSIEERLVHKDWKQRVAAYEIMKSDIDSAESNNAAAVIDKYAPYISKCMNDSSAPALDKAVDAIIAFIDTASIKLNAAQYATDVCTACVNKCATVKLSTKAKYDILILLLVECGAATDVVTTLLAGVENKNPKVAPICIEWFNKALTAFGPAVIPYNAVQKVLPKLFDSTNAALKAQATEMCLVLHRYMGALFKPAALNLKSATEKDLNDKISATQTGLQPTRAVRSKNSAGKSVGKGADGSEKPLAAPAFDPLASIAAVDIVSKLSKNWCDLVVNEEKWQDRVSKLQELSTLATNTPKIIVTNNMTDVTASLKKTLKGSNASVILESVKCVAALCRSARKGYAPHAKQLFPLIIVLLKEKAASFKAQLNPSLDAIYEHTVELNDISEDVAAQLTDKVSLTRTNACEYLTRCLNNEKTTSKSMTVDTVKLLGSTLLKLINDADAGVRDAALAPTAALIHIVTRKPFSTELDKLRDSEPKRYDRLDKAIAARASGNNVSAEPLSAKSLPPSPTSGSTTARSVPTAVRNSKSLGANVKPKPVTTAPIADKPSASTTAAGKKSVSGSGSSEANFTPDEGLSYETAAEQLSECVGSETVEMLNSKKWNEVADALKSISDKLAATDATTCDSLLAPFYYTVNKIPSFKPSNVNIAKQLYETTATVSCLATKLSKSCAYLPLADMLSKMSDKKLAEAGTQLIVALCECTSPKFIVSQILKLNGPDNKNVKAFECIIACVNKVVDEFTVTTIDLMELININKQWLANTNAGVKQAALALHATLYKQGGVALKPMLLADIQPKQQATVEAEFAQLDASGAVGQAVAARTVKGAEANTTPAAFDPLANIPRTDISSKITEALLKKLDDAKWTERKDAIAEVNSILTSAAHRITVNENGLTDVLKNRLVDANIVVARESMILVGTLAHDMGKDIKQYAGKLLPNTMTQLTNTKAHADALNTLKAWTTHAGFSSIVRYIAKGVTAPLARKSLCDIIAASLVNAQFTKTEKAELVELVAPLVICIQDKSKEVRESAQAALEQLVQYVKYDTIAVEGIQNLKQAEKLALQPFLEKLKQIAAGNKQAAQSATAQEEPAPVKRAPSNKGNKTARPSTAQPSTARQPAKPVAAPVSTADCANDEAETSNAASALPKILSKVDMKAKQARLKLDGKRMKGQFREWGGDEIDEIATQIRTYTSDDFSALLYHKDFQKQVSALDQLNTAMQTHFDAIYSISDLICKWCSTRLHDANTSLLQSILDVLTQLLTQIQTRQQQNAAIVFSDGEAGVLLPFMLEKVFGHNQPRFRTDARKLVKLIAVVYSSVKVYTAVQAGLDSKNKRVQSECLEELNEMNVTYGINIVDYKKFVVQLGSSMVGSTDSTVRKAALDLLATYYIKLGQQLYVLLGKNQLGAAGDQVSEKCMSMIDERLKRVKMTEDGQTNAQPAEPINRPKTPVRSKGSISPTATPQRITGRAQSLQNSGLKRPSVVNKQPVNYAAPEEQSSYEPTSGGAMPDCFSLDVGGRQLGTRVSINNNPNRMSFRGSGSPMQHQQPSISPPHSAHGNNNVASGIERQIERGVPADDAMKQLWQRLIDNNDRTWLAGEADCLVELCIAQVDQSFTYDNNQQLIIAHRRATGSINILSELFKSATLPSEVTVSTVERALQVFIPLLLNEQFRKSSVNDTKQLLQQCNKFILKFVTDCEPTTALVALIQQIKQQTHIAIKQGGSQDNPPGNKPLIDLLIKCELKTARAVDMQKVQVDQVLAAIHAYYELCGLSKDTSSEANPAELASRKLMRTLLQTLIQHFGNATVDMLPANADNNSIIRRYTERILQEINAGGNADNATSPAHIVTVARMPALRTGQAAITTAQHLYAAGISSVDDNSPQVNVTDDAEYLRSLLKNTTDVNQSQVSFQKLADYIQVNPHVDVYQYAVGISDSFQQHIKRTVSRIIGDKAVPASMATYTAAAPTTLPAAVPLRRPSTSGGTTVDDIRRRLAAMQMGTIKSTTTAPTPTSASQLLSATVAPSPMSAATPSPLSATSTTSNGSQTTRVASSTLEAIKQRLAANQGRSTLGGPGQLIPAAVTPSNAVMQPAPSPLTNVSNISIATPVAAASKSVDLAAIKARLAGVRSSTLSQPIAPVPTMPQP